jgi:hypothetical protein
MTRAGTTTEQTDSLQKSSRYSIVAWVAILMCPFSTVLAGDDSRTCSLFLDYYHICSSSEKTLAPFSQASSPLYTMPCPFVRVSGPMVCRPSRLPRPSTPRSAIHLVVLYCRPPSRPAARLLHTPQVLKNSSIHAVS